MGLNINTNVSALEAVRQTNRAAGLLTRTFSQLASAQRITRAADDAAGLAIAERLNTRVRQGQAEINSLQSGVSAVQTADGGLAVQQEAVQRIRELAVQASNGTLSDDQRAALNAEAQELLQQIDAVGSDTEFNGLNLLDGSQSAVTLDPEGSAQLNLQESTVDSLGLNGLDLSTQAGAAAALGAADNALNQISQNRAGLGAQQNRFERAISQREIGVQNNIEAESRIRDLDFAQASIARTRNQLLLQTGIAGIVQSNLANQSALGLLR